MGGSSASGSAARGSSRRTDRVAAVSAVAAASTSLMALLYGCFLGALSALLVMVIATRVAPGFVVPLQRAALALVAWIVSSWWLSRNALGLLAVFRRGFLLGAVQWLAVDLVGGPELRASASSGAAPGGSGAADPLTGGVALVMLGLCLTGYLVCRWSSPPRAPSTASVD